MKEKLKEFVAEKRAVSPVIGVVLMVAVVVILAAVIGAFVLGLGGDQQATPQASFSYDPSVGTNGQLVLSGGDTLDAANVYVSVDGATPSAWGTGDISAGATKDLGSTPAESIRITYDDGSGETATLWQTTV